MLKLIAHYETSDLSKAKEELAAPQETADPFIIRVVDVEYKPKTDTFFISIYHKHFIPQTQSTH